MNFIKEVFKKLLITAIVGAVILAFVHYKDHYLEQGTSDMEMLNSVTLEKETQGEKIMEKETNENSSVSIEEQVQKNLQSSQAEPPLVMKVEKPYEEVEVHNSVEDIESIKGKEIIKYREVTQEPSVTQLESQTNKKIITDESVAQQQSFDEFKSSVKSRAQNAFDELDRETE